MNLNTIEYYNRSTDRTSFTVRDILNYDLETDTYKTAEWFSPELAEYMLQNLGENDTNMFKDTAKSEWSVNL
jgi:hypothetical protein